MSAICKIIDSFRGQITLGIENNRLGDRALEEFNNMLIKQDALYTENERLKEKLDSVYQSIKTLKELEAS